MSETWISTADGFGGGRRLVSSLSGDQFPRETPAMRASGSGTESDECSWQADPIRVTRPRAPKCR